MGKIISTTIGFVLGSCLTLGVLAVGKEELKMLPHYANNYLRKSGERTRVSGTVVEEHYIASLFGDEYILSLKTKEGKKVIVRFDDCVVYGEPKYLNAQFQQGDNVTLKVESEKESRYVGLEGWLDK